MKTTFATVCTGIGAPEQAWRSLGWEPQFFSEIEPFPCAVLKHHYPLISNYGDMTKFNDWPNHDLTDGVICAGTPCQAFSVAGLRKGLDDPRGNLTLTYLAIIRRYRPKYVVWENVPGVLSDKTGAFGAFLGGLGELGYGFAYRVLDAQYFGVPQRRRRVFVVGCLGSWQRAAAVLFERQSLSGDYPPSRKTGESFTHDLAPSLTSSGRGVERTGKSRGQDPVIAMDCRNGADTGEVSMTLQAKKSGYSYNCQPVIAHTLGKRYDSSEDGTGRGLPLVMAHGQGNAEVVRDGSPSLTCNHKAPICFKGGQGAKARSLGLAENISPTLPTTNSGGNCVPVVALQDIRGMDKKQNGKGYNDDGSAYTVDAMATQGIATPMSVRRLTPRECERLQGFPDDFTLVPFRGKPAADGPRYKAIGNSMAVPVLKWIGQRIEMVNSL